MSSSQSKQQQGQPRHPAFTHWPTIKIFMPPQGRFSPSADEWCFTYCNQSVTGRIHGTPPECSTICIRKVFPHEVQNILSFKRHSNVQMEKDKDGNMKAKYPLPLEGQAAHVPRILGGKKVATANVEDSSPEKKPVPFPPNLDPKNPDTRFWNTGYYLFSSSNVYGTLEHLSSMHLDVSKLAARQTRREKTKQEWLEYQDWLERVGGVDNLPELEEGIWKEGLQGEAGEEAKKYWGHKQPPRLPPPNYLDGSALVPLSPASAFQLSEKIDKLLAPSKRALELFSQDVSSGTFTKFGHRIWEKSLTDEPAQLAMRSWEKLCDAWKKAGENSGGDDDNSRRR
ncbi:hypothetical protein BDP27DRAFT_1315302 [Rhodocollybia butyracea]|uniref:Uncharacterized protein n=1 Tax=Rhodocollybia butyracea TaxID=206335 RepID=A0A9P5Q6M9_9AGAR|nr:hypothetical protein BDP27DRAFT_1315302 [Rhodocollybia butyracea]